MSGDSEDGTLLLLLIIGGLMQLYTITCRFCNGLGYVTLLGYGRHICFNCNGSCTVEVERKREANEQRVSGESTTQGREFAEPSL